MCGPARVDSRGLHVCILSSAALAHSDNTLVTASRSLSTQSNSRPMARVVNFFSKILGSAEKFNANVLVM